VGITGREQGSVQGLDSFLGAAFLAAGFFFAFLTAFLAVFFAVFLAAFLGFLAFDFFAAFFFLCHGRNEF